MQVSPVVAVCARVDSTGVVSEGCVVHTPQMPMQGGIASAAVCKIALNCKVGGNEGTGTSNMAGDGDSSAQGPFEDVGDGDNGKCVDAKVDEIEGSED
jgi:hypothetical protein